MHLVSCDTPQGLLEAAPRTALLAEVVDGEQWDGFWSPQTDAYYARCTRGDGAVEWFALVDESSATVALPAARPVAAPDAHAALTGARVVAVLAQSPSGRKMLVGSARRSARA